MFLECIRMEQLFRNAVILYILFCYMVVLTNDMIWISMGQCKRDVIHSITMTS